MPACLQTDVPGAPVNVQVSIVTSSTIGLTWSPPLVSETLGIPIYSYSIICSRDSQHWEDVTLMKTTDRLSAMFSQLDPFSHYNCCVAVNSENGQGKSACISVITGTAST